MDGLRPRYTPRALAAAIPSCWRSRRRLVSNSANTPNMSRKAFPVALWVLIGCSVARRVTPRAFSRYTIELFLNKESGRLSSKNHGGSQPMGLQIRDDRQMKALTGL